MPVAPRIFTPAEIADTRFRYVESDEPLVSIAKRLGTSEKTLSRNIRTWGWPYRRQTVRREMAQPAPIPVALTPPAPASEDEVAAADIELTVQREVTAIRMIVARLPKGRNVSAAERSARALATLTRTLQEVIRLRPKQATAEPANDRGPADDNEFVRELVRRMDEFGRRRQAAVRADPAGGDA